jgi:uncharacterized protein YbjT (DUF2867 family)
MIAVMGASGNVGGRVSELLLREKQNVRAFGRSAERLDALGRQGAEVLVGDALNVHDLEVLFRGAEAALVVLPDNVTDPHYVSNRSTMSRAITHALHEQPVGHVVLASSLGADHDRGVGPVAGLHELEGLLFGLDATNVLSLRAPWHMENLIASLPLIEHQKINGSAIEADRSFPMIATADIAERAAQHLLRRDFRGHAVESILGPEDHSMAEATKALGAALGIPDLPYVQFPPEGVKAALLGAGMSEEVAGLLVEGQIAINQNRINGVQRTPENTTTTRLDDFLKGAFAR